MAKTVLLGNEKEQKDTAHLVELVAASALFDFLGRPTPDTPQAMTRAIRENVDALDMSSLGEGYKPMVKDIANMMIFNLLLDILPTERRFPLKKTRGLNKDFYQIPDSHPYWEMVYVDKGKVLVSNEKDEIVLKTIIDLFKSLGITIVQEGVETEEMLNKLVGYGCDVIQGYYYAKAISLEEFRVFLKTNTSIMYKSKVK